MASLPWKQMTLGYLEELGSVLLLLNGYEENYLHVESTG